MGKLIALAILLAAAVLLCGCAARDHAVELELWITDFNQDTRALIDDDLVPRFEAAHPGVAVNTQYISWTHIDEKLTISFAGGVAPDIFQVGAEYVGGLAYRGMAAPLDDLDLQELERAKKAYPRALVVVHPEARKELLD